LTLEEKRAKANTADAMRRAAFLTALMDLAKSLKEHAIFEEQEANGRGIVYYLHRHVQETRKLAVDSEYKMTLKLKGEIRDRCEIVQHIIDETDEGIIKQKIDLPEWAKEGFPKWTSEISEIADMLITAADGKKMT
jgi:hypothetical protein